MEIPFSSLFLVKKIVKPFINYMKTIHNDERDFLDKIKTVK